MLHIPCPRPPILTCNPETRPSHCSPSPTHPLAHRYAYPIKCTGFTKDPVTGQVTELAVEYDPEFKGKKPPKGVLNWVACPAPGVAPPSLEVRLYDLLFTVDDPAASETWLEELNPDSLTVIQGALACPELSTAKVRWLTAGLFNVTCIMPPLLLVHCACVCVGGGV